MFVKKKLGGFATRTMLYKFGLSTKAWQVVLSISTICVSCPLMLLA